MLCVPEFRVLMILSADRNATVTGIADGLNVSRFVAAALIESLRREGFIEGERGEVVPSGRADHAKLRAV